MNTPESKIKVKKEFPSSPWNCTLPSKMEMKLYSRPVLLYKGDNKYTKTVISDIMEMQTIDVG